MEWNTKVKRLTEGQLKILAHLEPSETGTTKEGVDWVTFLGTDPTALARRVSGVLGFAKSDKSSLLKILSAAKDADTINVYTWKGDK